MYLSGTKWAVIGLFSDPQYGPLDFLLTSFSRSVLEVTVPGFSTSIHGRRASYSGRKLNLENVARNSVSKRFIDEMLTFHRRQNLTI